MPEIQYARAFQGDLRPGNEIRFPADEAGYRLELLLKTNDIDPARYQELANACSQIRVMLIKSINTAKGDVK